MLAPPNCVWEGVEDFHSSVLANSFLSSGSFPPTKLHPPGDTPLLYPWLAGSGLTGDLPPAFTHYQVEPASIHHQRKPRVT